jgi:hypothetical protein
MCIQIVYGMAYHFDCGAFPGGGCSGADWHLGDSEFYIALAKRNSAWSTAKTHPADWQLIGDFTSAHFGTSGGICPAESSDAARYGVNAKDCFTLYGYNYSACLADTDCKMNYMSTPHCENNCFSIGLGARSSYTTIYVSQGKHGMYHSVSACSGGGCAGTDSCNANSGIDLRTGKTCFNLQNVGNSNASTAFKRTIRTPNTSVDDYNVWGGTKFGDASPYLRPFNSTVAWCMN